MDYQQIAEHGKNIRVHGNGFIQVDLPGDERIHVWGHPAIPRQAFSSQIHDHRFGFVSTILAGALVNLTYQTLPAPDNQVAATHSIFTPSMRVGEDTVLIDSGLKLFVRAFIIEHHGPGATYVMDAKIFHETFVNQPTVTHMRKTHTEDHTPRVLIPIGGAPDNDFNRYDLPVKKLWAILKETMGGANG